MKTRFRKQQAGVWIGWMALLFGVAGWAAPDYDLVLRRGRVIDGTGNPAYRADVAIRDGRIAAIGRIAGTGRQERDVGGRLVAPGFIDVHTHAEELEELPLAENFARQGVTTVVMGNCGSSRLDLGAYFRRLETNGISVNAASLVGHGTVRGRAMKGASDRPPTEVELAEMRGLVAQAMRDGAVGLSTGLIYLPGSFARTEEIVELAKVAADYDGIYATHMRSESGRIFEALEEVFTIAREAGIRAQVSHIKLSGKPNWGRAAEVLGAIEKARAEGLDITQDQYLYVASSTGISQLIPDAALDGGRLRERLADPPQKTAIIAGMKAILSRAGREDYEYAQIAFCRSRPDLNGLRIPEAARKARGSDSLDDQIELILDLQARGGATGVFYGISEEDLQAFLRHPHTMIGSDSGVRRWEEGVPHPRGYGNSARLLARYVRELGCLRIEDAIRRMTSLPATTFRLTDRGLLRPGCWADVVVFDPAQVQDRATFEHPHQYAAGFDWVLVNGVAVVEQDRHTGQRPGRVIRRSQTAAAGNEPAAAG